MEPAKNKIKLVIPSPPKMSNVNTELTSLMFD